VNRLAAVLAIVAVALAGAGVLVSRSSRSARSVAPAPDASARRAPLGAAPPPATSAPAPAGVERTPRKAVRPKTPAVTETPAPAPPAAAAPETATLTITSDIAGAQVFLDRQFVGATPATAKDVAPGAHQLNVSAPGYDNHVQTVDVAAGAREITVTFREVRLDAGIDVVHKHRMGSCQGRLIATSRGLRYDTADKDDAFSAALLDLDTFQVDYLSKNLRIQPRRGKRYDFTDPDGNADRLFVFHRDVDRARERLKKGDVPSPR
jgi:PEGA domain-containing protein